MSSVEERYAGMWATARAAFASGRFQIDPHLNAPADNRRGITLRMRLRGEVLERTLSFQERLRAIVPDLYLPAPSELHGTVLGIVSCRDGCSIDLAAEERYARIIAEACRAVGSFSIEFRGITASAESVMLRGYPIGEILEHIRGRLRSAFAGGEVFSTIDSRYRLITAHSTIARFRSPPERRELFIESLEEVRNHDFGTLEVQEFELVHNDWWHRAANTRLIQTIALD